MEKKKKEPEPTASKERTPEESMMLTSNLRKYPAFRPAPLEEYGGGCVIGGQPPRQK